MQRREETARANNLALTVFLRHDQQLEDISNDKYTDGNVTIFAPSWVREGLDILNKYIHAYTPLTIVDRRGESQRKMFNTEDKLNLKDLLMLSRNEQSNVSGRINFQLYGYLQFEHKNVIYSIKDLARHCITIGTDETTRYGGYPGNCPSWKQNKPVIIIDLIGLQFQQAYNSGRLVLIGKELIKGVLDDLIFNNVVGEVKKDYYEAKMDKSGRYVSYQNYYFDTYAYQMFVANDFLLVCKALNQMDIPDVNLKFLKYGTGFFAGPFGPILENNIMKGIFKGMTDFFNTTVNKRIKSFEFPFYRVDQEISALCYEKNVQCTFSTKDALMQTSEFMTATTNCADPHAVTGNEMGYSSVDAAIAENIKSKGHKFSPVINEAMGYKYIDIRTSSDCSKSSKLAEEPMGDCNNEESKVDDLLVLN